MDLNSDKFIKLLRFFALICGNCCHKFVLVLKSTVAEICQFANQLGCTKLRTTFRDYVKAGGVGPRGAEGGLGRGGGGGGQGHFEHLLRQHFLVSSGDSDAKHS